MGFADAEPILPASGARQAPRKIHSLVGRGTLPPGFRLRFGGGLCGTQDNRVGLPAVHVITRQLEVALRTRPGKTNATKVNAPVVSLTRPARLCRWFARR